MILLISIVVQLVALGVSLTQTTMQTFGSKGAAALGQMVNNITKFLDKNESLKHEIANQALSRKQLLQALTNFTTGGFISKEIQGRISNIGRLEKEFPKLVEQNKQLAQSAIAAMNELATNKQTYAESSNLVRFSNPTLLTKEQLDYLINHPNKFSGMTGPIDSSKARENFNKLSALKPNDQGLYDIKGIALPDYIVNDLVNKSSSDLDKIQTNIQGGLDKPLELQYDATVGNQTTTRS